MVPILTKVKSNVQIVQMSAKNVKVQKSVRIVRMDIVLRIIYVKVMGLIL